MKIQPTVSSRIRAIALWSIAVGVVLLTAFDDSSSLADEAVDKFLERLKKLGPERLRELQRKDAERRGREGIAKYTRLIRENPSNTFYYINRSSGHVLLREYGLATNDLMEAIRLRPKDPQTLNFVAWILVISSHDEIRDGLLGVNFSKEACRLTDYRDAQFLDTLAAAYAESGDFEKAVQWSTKAVELANTNDKVIAELNLRTFRQRQTIAERTKATSAQLTP